MPRQATDPLDEMLHKASQLDDAMPKVELLQQAIDWADTHHDERAYQARIALMEVTLHLGRADLLMVAFAWCLAKAEANPEQYDYVELLWRFRWAIVNMPSFPTIPRSQIDSAIADMSRRYKAAGAAMRAVHLLRWKVAMGLHDLRLATEARRAWSRSPTGWLCDDHDTERVTQLKYLLQRERWTEAVAWGDDWIVGRRAHLAFEESVLAWLLIPLLRLKRDADAMRCHLRCQRLCGTNVALVVNAANNLTFLALTHNFTRGLKLIERHLAFCVRSDPEDQFEFFIALLTMMRMLQRVGRANVKLKLEPHCHGYQADGNYEAAAMEAVYVQQLRGLATAYDRRNGNPSHRRWLEESSELLTLARPISLQS